MKVLIVHNAYQSHHVGGEDVVVANEIAALKKILGENHLFEYLVSNDDIRPLKLMKDIWGSQTHFNNILNLVQQNSIDIVHIHNFFPMLTASVFAAAKQGGAKVVHTLHNFRWWCSSGLLYRSGVGECEKCLDKKFGWPGVVHACYRNSFAQSLAANAALSWYRLKDYAKNIDAYFVLTHFQKQKCQSKIPDAKMLLKPNAIEEPESITPWHAKKDYLFVGRLEVAKGIELLLSIWQQLPAHFTLTIVGTGDNDVVLQNRYARANIIFLGKLPHTQVLQRMNEAKYFIHSSLTYETFGLTLVEALSRGTPVIGLDRGPRSEFIQSGKNGFLCQPENLKEVILQSYDFTEYEALSRQAVESAKPFYSQKVVALQIELYQQLLSTASVVPLPLVWKNPLTVSIITVCYNSAKTIEQTIQSVLNQDYAGNIEYIIVDGGSTDGTLDIIKKYQEKIALVISEPDKGIYDAMNKGIARAKGDIVGLLNADDIYADEKVVSTLQAVMQNQAIEACYGDLIYFSDNNPEKIVRYWRSRDFKMGLFAKGWCPPHPTFFVKRKVYLKHGTFDTSYRMGNDVELMMRFLEKYKITCAYIPQVLVKMRIGGVSNSGFKNILVQNKCILRAARTLDIPISTIIFFICKLTNRIQQFIQKPLRGSHYVN